jgi:hypothetical protein
MGVSRCMIFEGSPFDSLSRDDTTQQPAKQNAAPTISNPAKPT